MHLLDLLIENGVSCATTYPQLGPTLYDSRWHKDVTEVDELEKEDCFIVLNTKGSAMTIHSRHNGLLLPTKIQLLVFICKLRDQAVQYTNQMVMREASCIIPAFETKTNAAKEQNIHLFTKHNGLTHHIATHTTQKHCKETKN